MSAEILDGKKLAKEIKYGVSKAVDGLGFQPVLATVYDENDEASTMYVGMKKKAAAEAGIKTLDYPIGAGTTQSQILETIGKLNSDGSVNGILVQLPLPKGVDEQVILNSINPLKDVDGFTPANLGALSAGDETMVSATPKGVIRLLGEYGIGFKGKEAVIVNHSIVVGRPLSMLLLNRNATVTVCHIHTKDLASHTRNADLLFSATGVAGLIKKDMVKEGAVVVDIGVAKTEKGVVGDVDFEEVSKKASYITPVPGGTGPMTIASLLENTIIAARIQGRASQGGGGST
ncbi:MAG TPA: bifunctional 5,10-methylenetetrahydrofolate dehydrogenase/5,10-methenyltetrahydrofolate cyclohydrolase [Candidatus Altiarchaeales archaeon]|nr:bifunctional 5,10-methylenetetrahydrofolate dehydrogenase/5,10-methenyltetrahydrofolate cyclohydrolase [Candidatus Altiarchaeales archaeon]